MNEEINSEIIDFKKPYIIFPFLSSFPFSEYEISIQKSVEDDIQVDPMIAKEAYSLSALDFINFTYKYQESDISFYFYTFNIEYLCSASKKVIKLDYIREILDFGINSNDIEIKLKSIIAGEVFIKKLGNMLLAGNTFDLILDEMFKSQQVNIKNIDLEKIKRFKNIDYSLITNAAKDCVLDYYDLHLHHIKILLGIVIAYKIY